MAEFGIKVGDGNRKSAIYLKDDCRYVLLTGLDEIPRVGTEVVIDGESWRLVEWTDRVECERVVN
jgi:hypothetical protein